MIDIQKDISKIRLHCQFSRPEQLIKLLQFRLRDFIELIEKVGEQSGNKVLWTNQHGGKVLKANVDLSDAACQALAKQVEENQEFDFFAWTPWENQSDVGLSFTRRQLLGEDDTYINISFPRFHYIHDLDLKKIMDNLMDFENQKDIGFSAQVALFTNSAETPFGYQHFNIYHHSNQGQFQNMGVERRVNSDLPEDVYVDPRDLAAEWLPKLRKVNEA